jgi:Nitroreductase family
MRVNHPDHQSPEIRTSIRMDARLDAVTRVKVDDLAQRFHQPRAAVLCHIMPWGLGRGQTEMLDGGESEGPVRHLYLYVDTAWHARGEKAAMAAGVNIAPWLRSMVHQITLTDFPASWQEDQSEERSHDFRIYDTRFIVRLDSPSYTTLQQLVQQFGASKAHIIRQLIMQATPENFPKSWHMRAAERSVPPIRRRETKNNREITRSSVARTRLSPRDTKPSRIASRPLRNKGHGPVTNTADAMQIPSLPPPTMPLEEAMRTQRALRRFKSDPVDDALVLRLIELALKVPTGRNAQHWEFVLVKDRAVKARLARVYRLAWRLYGRLGRRLTASDPKM